VFDEHLEAFDQGRAIQVPGGRDSIQAEGLTDIRQPAAEQVKGDRLHPKTQVEDLLLP
jgi:hypothetical protein